MTTPLVGQLTRLPFHSGYATAQICVFPSQNLESRINTGPENALTLKFDPGKNWDDVPINKQQVNWIQLLCAKRKEARDAEQYSICGKTRGGQQCICWLFLNICWGSTKTWRIERLGRSLKGNDRETIDFIEFIGKTLLVLRIPNGNTNIIPNRCVRLWDTVGINATQSH